MDNLKTVNLGMANLAGAMVGSVLGFDVGIAPEMVGGGKTNEGFMSLSYNDYLRILLLLQDKDRTLYRVLDIIQLNMQMKEDQFFIANLNPFIEIEVEISIPYLFLTGLFVDDTFKNDNKKRHVIKTNILRGY